ncbi:MAG: sensor histidine kinase [Sarcina sp.]
MNIVSYIKDRIYYLALNIMIFIIVTFVMLLAKVPIVIIFLVFLIWFLPLIIYIVFEYIKSKKYYGTLAEINENLDKKYLLPEMVEKPNFIEGKIVHEILREANKSMYENVKVFKNKEEEYREYIETWVHEIKTPIASMKLILENNKEIGSRFTSELDKVELFIEQVLYYSRSNDVSKDYIVKEFSLKEAVFKVIKRNSRDFIHKRILLDVFEEDILVYSDPKWVEFIVNQIIGNSVKYSKTTNGKILIAVKKEKESINLLIKDNGVGIDKKDLRRVFDKGFTGENGRIFGQSTGMGLYLCKKLSEKLGIGMKLSSEIEVGTEVELIFPLGSMTGKLNLIE